MTVDLTLLLIDEDRVDRTDLRRNWQANVAIELENGSDGENFFDLIEQLPSEDVPHDFWSRYNLDENSKMILVNFYRSSQILQAVRAGDIIRIAKENPRVMAYRLNRGAIGYLSAIDPDSRVVLRFH